MMSRSSTTLPPTLLSWSGITAATAPSRRKPGNSTTPRWSDGSYSAARPLAVQSPNNLRSERRALAAHSEPKNEEKFDGYEKILHRRDQARRLVRRGASGKDRPHLRARETRMRRAPVRK